MIARLMFLAPAVAFSFVLCGCVPSCYEPREAWMPCVAKVGSGEILGERIEWPLDLPPPAWHE